MLKERVPLQQGMTSTNNRKSLVLARRVVETDAVLRVEVKNGPEGQT
jgi:hypothetical protein